MARPLSEDKKQALLDAATDVVGLQGLGAPTAQIARLAGVAEGTLFRYFATKEVLLQELLAHLSRDLGEALERDHDPAATMKSRITLLWSNYIDWGIQKPNAHRAMMQLAASGMATRETCADAMTRCEDVRGVMGDVCDLPGLDGLRSSAFADTVLSALAQVTIDAAAREPAQADAYKQIGFGILWRGLVGGP